MSYTGIFMMKQEKYLKKFCAPKHLWKETIYRLHNSQTAGHLGIKATIQEFRKQIYYPGFTEHFISFIKNCLFCLQLNRVPKNHITPKLQPVSSLQSYPVDMLQIDFVGPLVLAIQVCFEWNR